MALDFIIAESPCIKWRTYLPRVNYFNESQVFRLGSGNFKFQLNCICSSNEFGFGFQMPQVPFNGFPVPFNGFQMPQVPFNVSNCTSEVFDLSLKNCNKPKLNFQENLSVYVENNDGRRKLCYFGKVNKESSFQSLSMPSLKSDYGISGDEITFLFIFDMHRVREPTPEEVARPTQSTPLKSETPRIQSSCLQTFSEDIKKLLGNTDYSDAVIKCGDKSFPVNRNILSVRSEVFAAMFRNKLKESETGVVEIPNVEPNVMERFLHYIYSGRVEALSMTTACGLYQISDLYNVPSLKGKCASLLAHNLTEDLVCQVLQLAQQYENKELLEIAISFVTTKAEFIKTATWKMFAKVYPDIAVEVYMKLHEN